MFSSVIFFKGKQLFNLMFASLDSKPLQNGSTLEGKEFAPKGANSFLEELTNIEKGGKHENG